MPAGARVYMQAGQRLGRDDGTLVHSGVHDRRGGARPALADVAPGRIRPSRRRPAALATETGFYEDQLREIERDEARGLIAPPEAEAARTEAARRLLRANRAGVPGVPGMAEPALRQRRAASAFALSTIPLVALIAYGIYGSPHMPAQSAAERQAAQSGDQDLLKAIGQIEARLAADPTDGRGWSVLAPVYMRMGRFDDAAHAYEAATRHPRRDAAAPVRLGRGPGGGGQRRRSRPRPRPSSSARSTSTARSPSRNSTWRGRPNSTATFPGRSSASRPWPTRRPADAPWLPLVRENLARLKGEPAPGRHRSRAEAGAGRRPPGPAAGKPRRRHPRPWSTASTSASPTGAARLDDWLRLVRSYGVLEERDKAERRPGAGAQGPGGRSRGQGPPRRDRRGRPVSAGTSQRTAAAASAPSLRSRPPRPTMPRAAGTEAAVAAVKAMPAAERDAAIRGMVAGLDRRLAAKGGSVDDWLRLVRSYSVLGERERAAPGPRPGPHGPEPRRGGDRAPRRIVARARASHGPARSRACGGPTASP